MWVMVLLSLLALKAAPAMGAAPALSIVPVPKQRDLMAEGSDVHFWVAHVGKASEGNDTQTLIVWRGKWSGNGEWTTLPMIPDQVVISMATSNDELLMVLKNGQWEIADGLDIRTGPTPPQGDVMLAIAGDPDAVWAVVKGLILPPASTQESETLGATNPPASRRGNQRRSRRNRRGWWFAISSDGKWTTRAADCRMR